MDDQPENLTKKPRGNISVRGSTYRRLQVHCDVAEATISGYLERVLSEALDAREALNAREALKKTES